MEPAIPYRIHKSPPLVCVLYESNPVDGLQTHLFNIYFERIMFIVKQNVTFSTIALYYPEWKRFTLTQYTDFTNAFFAFKVDDRRVNVILFTPMRKVRP
jgi:hypothetical protein